MILSFPCPICGDESGRAGGGSFRIDLGDPNWITGDSAWCPNCGAGYGPDAAFFWNALKKEMNKAEPEAKTQIRQALMRDVAPYLTDRSVMDGDDWTEFLLLHPDSAPDATCPWGKFSSGNWVRLLTGRRDLDTWCPWNRITPGDWIDLLAERRDLEQNCPWDLFSSGDWVKLLARRPELAKRCRWKDIEHDDVLKIAELSPIREHVDLQALVLSGNSFAFYTIVDKLNLADRCDWSSFQTGDAWCTVLKDHPGLISVCNLEMLASEHWVDLLSSAPELSSHCPWDRITFSSDDWIGLIKTNPKLAESRPWEKIAFSPGNWVDLLIDDSLDSALAKEIEDICPWKELSDADWRKLLGHRPEMVRHFSITPSRIWNYDRFDSASPIYRRLARRFIVLASLAFLLSCTFALLWGKTGWFALYSEARPHAIVSGCIWLVILVLWIVFYTMAASSARHNRWTQLISIGALSLFLSTVFYWTFFFTRGSLPIFAFAAVPVLLLLAGSGTQGKALFNWPLAILAPALFFLAFFVLRPNSADACYGIARSLYDSYFPFESARRYYTEKGQKIDPDFIQLREQLKKR